MAEPKVVTMQTGIDWKHFQDIVASIERIMGDRCSVESPARLRNRHGSGTREIDVLIRIKEGRREILVAIECRRRRCRSDIIWMEQLASKRDNLGLDRIVAVSATPFTRQASDYAREKHIELMELSDFYDGKWQPWLLCDHIPFRCSDVVFRKVMAHLVGLPPLEIAGEDNILRNGVGEVLPFRTLWFNNAQALYSAISPDNPPQLVETTLIIADNCLLEIQLEGSWVRVVSFAVLAEICVLEKAVPLIPAVSYKDVLGDQVVLGYSETAFPIDVNGQKFFIGIAKVPPPGVYDGAGVMVLVQRPAD